MALFNWQASLSVGNTAIDAQHKKLIEIINQLHEAMQKGKGSEVLGKLLDNLADYTETHFKYEEGVLKSASYPALTPHQQEHAKFVERIRNMGAEFKSGRKAMSLELLTVLKDWLRSHIMVSDQKYAAYFKTKTAPAMAAR